MKAIVLTGFKTATGKTFLPGDTIEAEPEKLKILESRGRVRIKPDQALPERVIWESPVFGRLSGGPVLEMTETTFTLVHPLTGEKVTLSREWLVTREERSAIMKNDAGLPREEADRKAWGMFLNQFRKKREG